MAKKNVYNQPNAVNGGGYKTYSTKEAKNTNIYNQRFSEEDDAEEQKKVRELFDSRVSKLASNTVQQQKPQQKQEQKPKEKPVSNINKVGHAVSAVGRFFGQGSAQIANEALAGVQQTIGAVRAGTARATGNKKAERSAIEQADRGANFALEKKDDLKKQLEDVDKQLKGVGVLKPEKTKQLIAQKVELQNKLKNPLQGGYLGAGGISKNIKDVGDDSFGDVVKKGGAQGLKTAPEWVPVGKGAKAGKFVNASEKISKTTKVVEVLKDMNTMGLQNAAVGLAGSIGSQFIEDNPRKSPKDFGVQIAKDTAQAYGIGAGMEGIGGIFKLAPKMIRESIDKLKANKNEPTFSSAPSKLSPDDFDVKFGKLADEFNDDMAKANKKLGAAKTKAVEAVEQKHGKLLDDLIDEAEAPIDLDVPALNKAAKNSLANDKTGIKPGGVKRAAGEIDNASAKPIEYRRTPEGDIVIVDGRHRLEAASKKGINDFPTKDVSAQFNPEQSARVVDPNLPTDADIQKRLNERPGNLKKIEQTQTQMPDSERLALTGGDTGQAGLMSAEAGTRKYNPATGKIETISPEVGAGKQSGVARSIDAKGIEKNLTKGLGDLAEYTPIEIKDQAERAAAMLQDTDQVKKILRGEAKLPQGLRGGAAIKAIEDHATQTGDVDLLRALAKSDIVAETSVHAQELRTLAERDPDSALAAIKSVADARKKAIEKRLGKSADKAIKETTAEIKKNVKAPTRMEWNTFIESIKCK